MKNLWQVGCSEGVKSAFVSPFKRRTRGLLIGGYAAIRTMTNGTQSLFTIKINHAFGNDPRYSLNGRTLCL